jgi:uncharacterized protein (TIGR02266 family)
MKKPGGAMESGRIRTSIETEFEIDGQRAQGRIKNMSEGGLFVGTASIPEAGENIDLNFRGPGGGVVSLSGLVWWTTNDGGRHRAPGFGLRLLDDSEELQGLLANL